MKMLSPESSNPLDTIGNNNISLSELAGTGGCLGQIIIIIILDNQFGYTC